MILIKEKPNSKVPGITSFFISFKYNQDIIDNLKTVQMYVYDKNTKEWEVPITSLANIIDILSPFDDIQIELLKVNDKKDKIFELSKYKTKPFDYQEEGIQYGLNHDKWLLLDAPGLGKTLQLTYLAQELKKRDKIEHCLIICGINTLKTNWKKEIQKHSNLSCMILGERVNTKGKTVFEGVPYRLEQLSKPIKEFFVITNVETLRDDKIVKSLIKGKNKFDMVIFDEVHVCKSPQSQQGKNLLKLKSAKYKVGATGTLLMNNPLDTYMPLKWIGAEKANHSSFKHYYCIFGGNFGNDFLGYRNLDTLKDMLSRYSLRRDKSLLNLPPKTIINEMVDMPDRQRKFYDNVKAGVIDEVDKVKLKPAAVLGMVLRLRQATACPSILTTENIPSGKIDRCCDLVDQIISDGNKVVIFSTFKETLSELEKRLQQYKPLLCTGDLDDDIISNNVDIFQSNDDHKVFMGTWQKGGTGLTLTAANYMIFIDTPWTDAAFTQACDRIYRIGTDKNVFIYNLIANDSIDERVQEIVNDKAALSDYIIDDMITESGINSLKKYIQELR
jgi:SNF2 family DNA or RNA helicase